MKSFRKTLYLAVAGAAVGVIAATPVLAAESLTVVSWGGAYTNSQVQAYHKPWEKKTGIKINSEDYNGGLAQVKAQVESGNVAWDLVDVELSDAVRGCDEGLLEEIDHSILPPAPDGTAAKDDFIPGTLTECAVGQIVWSTVYAYDKSKFPGAKPTTFADFFDVKKFPGKRGMRKGPKLNLEFALMADGVAPGEVYKVLGTPAGIDRAFAKLDEIKSLVQWWEAGAQAPEWLAAGDVELSVAYNGRIANAQKEGKNLKMIWDRTVYAIDAWAIIKDAPNQEVGYKFLKYSADPGRQAAFTEAYAYGPTHKTGIDMVDPERAKSLPAGDNLQISLFGGSQEALDFWVDYQEELTERWNRWVTQN
jgi:putative spermidine/putrescine transport system substrate-binding protein